VLSPTQAALFDPRPLGSSSQIHQPLDQGLFLDLQTGRNVISKLKLSILKKVINQSRSQWPCGLWRGSAAARLLGLWVRSHRGHGCLSLVSVVCCQVEVSATGWSLVRRSPTDCGVSKV
jgi:hypothetical protein